MKEVILCAFAGVAMLVSLGLPGQTSGGVLQAGPPVVPITPGGPPSVPVYTPVTLAPNITYLAHIVTNQDAFGSYYLPYPAHSICFRNGILMEPGFDYAVHGLSFHTTTPVSNGDRVTVVTFTPAVPIDQLNGPQVWAH